MHIVPDICHKAPENRHYEQVKNTDIDEEKQSKSADRQEIVIIEEGDKKQLTGDKKEVNERHEKSAGPARNEPWKRGGNDQCSEECGAKKKGKIRGAYFDSELIAHGPKDIVSSENAKKVKEWKEDRVIFFRKYTWVWFHAGPLGYKAHATGKVEFFPLKSCVDGMDGMDRMDRMDGMDEMDRMDGMDGMDRMDEMDNKIFYWISGTLPL